jgi:hypothetical protein
VRSQRRCSRKFTSTRLPVSTNRPTEHPGRMIFKSTGELPDGLVPLTMSTITGDDAIIKETGDAVLRVYNPRWEDVSRESWDVLLKGSEIGMAFIPSSQTSQNIAASSRSVPEDDFLLGAFVQKCITMR